MKRLMIIFLLLLPITLWSSNQKVVRVSPQKALIVSVSLKKTVKADTSQNLIRATTTAIVEKKILNTISVARQIKNWQIKEAYEKPNKVIKRSHSIYCRENRIGFLWLSVKRFDSLAYESYVYRPKERQIYYKEMIIPVISKKFHIEILITLMVILSALIVVFFSETIGSIGILLSGMSFFCLISIFIVSQKLFVIVVVTIILVLCWRKVIMKRRRKKRN